MSAKRDRWLRAIEKRLDRVAQSHDLGPAMEPAALSEAGELALTLTDDRESLPARHRLGWLYWYRAQRDPEEQRQQDLQIAVSMFSYCFINGITEHLPEPLLPIVANQASVTAAELERAQGPDEQGARDAAIELWRRVAAATAAGTGQAAYLSRLGGALFARYERSGAEADLDDAIQHMKQAAAASHDDEPSRAAYLTNLGNTLRVRFDRSGAEADIDEAVGATRQGVALSSDDDPNRAAYLGNLGYALLARSGHSGAAADLDDAIENLRRAAQATHDDHPFHAGHLYDLGNALHQRFERSRDGGDLNDAVHNLQQAVRATAEDDPGYAMRLAGLGVAMRDRFGRFGDRADLDAAVETIQRAVEASDDRARALYLDVLGTALSSRFEHFGPERDIDAAIKHLRQAVQAASSGDPDQPVYQHDLGQALRVRFERLGAETDLNEAIEALQAAARAAPAKALYLATLGSALRLRSGRTGAAVDLDHAIEHLRQAVEVAQVDEHSYIFGHLGLALMDRFDRTDDRADLDDAILVARRAVQATPEGQPERAAMLSNLGLMVGRRFDRFGAEADLDSAIEAAKQAVQATSQEHPNRTVFLTTLAITLRTRFRRTGSVRDEAGAIQAYLEGAYGTAGTASGRIQAFRAAASMVAARDHGRAADLLEAAVLLLPEAVPRFLDRGDMQTAIARFDGLAEDAAAMALSDPAVPERERPARALRLLEAARALLLSQALSTRGDLSDLRDRHPELAARFVELRAWLDAPAQDGGLQPVPPPAAGSAFADAIVQDRRELAAEFRELLARIRGLDGFASFGLPPSNEQLLVQAEHGSVVVLTTNAMRSDAILLTSGGITSVPLTDLSRADVVDQVASFHQAQRTIAEAESAIARANAVKSMGRVLAWLWDHVTGPVLHALGYDEEPSDGEPWPQLWWVPVGPLSLLPVHAAGHHTSPPDPGRRAVMDRVVSSYTPTVGALAYSRVKDTESGPAVRSLIVSMPVTPGLPGGAELTFVPSEVAVVQTRLPNPAVLTESSGARAAAGSQLPTKAAVLKHLPGTSIAHFACHGYTDPTDPSRSRLLLHDHSTDPFTVAALAPLALEHAQLAYLSACATATATGDQLLDEAIHLASALQLAGFPHVIGTLWEIDDATAVEIAADFYAALANPTGILDPRRAAAALHQAVRTQRDHKPANPYLWASHVHAGA
jgi:tetratricopeptide (TPR) repeat protein